MTVNGGINGNQQLANILAIFRRFDNGGHGLMNQPDLKQILTLLDANFWTDSRLEVLLAESSPGVCHGKAEVRYEEFLRWLFDDDPRTGLSQGVGSFTLMTFNVEEYYHGYNRDKKEGKEAELKSGVFATIKGIRAIVETHAPDVFCIEEHSLGKGFTEVEIMEALIGNLGYDYVSQPTGENAWFSPLANAIVWKRAIFTQERSWRVQLAGVGDVVPGTSQSYTPRSAACVELTHRATGKRLAVCATHLMGGRFEDASFVAEALAKRNIRAEQAQKIACSIKETCGEDTPSVIAGDFNVMLDGYREGSAFRSTAQSYFDGTLINKALEMAAQAAGQTPGKEDYTFDGFYAPFQTQVHAVLSRELGYTIAYGRSDSADEMKTTFYSGCIDWVYIRNLTTLRDERVVRAIDDGLSDHNAVMVTLQLGCMP